MVRLARHLANRRHRSENEVDGDEFNSHNEKPRPCSRGFSNPSKLKPGYQ